MKSIAKRDLFMDGFLLIMLMGAMLVMPPISLKNPCTVAFAVLMLCITFFSVLPHLRVVELTPNGCIVKWLWLKKIYQWKELKIISYSSIGVPRSEEWEGLFFSTKEIRKNGKMFTPEKIAYSLDIFNCFYIIFDNKTQKEQIFHLLKSWEVEVTIDKKFAQQKEYERVVAEKTQMREERKKLYEESKKRKR